MLISETLIGIKIALRMKAKEISEKNAIKYMVLTSLFRFMIFKAKNKKRIPKNNCTT